jgi:hypothetical protein
MARIVIDVAVSVNGSRPKLALPRARSRRLIADHEQRCRTVVDAHGADPCQTVESAVAPDMDSSLTDDKLAV